MEREYKMDKDELKKLKEELKSIKFVDEENKKRVYELITKMEEGKLDEYEEEELLQIMEDEEDMGEKMQSFVEELGESLKVSE